MVPEEWPIEAPAGGAPADPAHRAGGDRLSAVMTDFFLDPANRLTEQERALIGALIDGLIGWIADQVRSALPNHATAANDADGHALRLLLGKAGLLQRRDLMAIVMRAADEERIASVASSRSPGSPSLLQRLISNPSAEVSTAAMELILARGRRRDRFGQLRLDFDDLAPELASALVHAVAAALRNMVIAVGGDEDTDAALGQAVGALMERHDPGKASGGLSASLVDSLSVAGMLDEELLASAMREGDARILSDSLARRSAIPGPAAWDMLTSGQSPLLLRMAGVSRRFAAELIAGLGDQLGVPDPSRGIESFDAICDSQVERTRRWTQFDPAYRSAIARLKANG